MKALKNLFAFGVAITVFWYLTEAASGQPRYEPTPAGMRRAIVEGKIKEALASYETQAREAEENATVNPAPEKFWEIALHAYSEASRAARLMGELQKALIYAERALANAEKTKNPDLQLRALNQNIHVQRRIGNFERVEKLIDTGFTLTKQLTNAGRRLWWEGNLYDQLGLEMTRKTEYQKAIDAYSRAVMSHETYLDEFLNQATPERTFLEVAKGNLIYELSHLGQAYRVTRELEQAIEQIEKAFSLAKNWGLKHSFETQLYYALGEIYLEKKNVPKAMENFKRALVFQENQQRSFPLHISSARRIGDILLERGQYDEALGYYQKAIEAVESARSILQSERVRQSFFEGELAAYGSMITTLSAAGKAVEAFNYNERVRSRVLLDLLGNKVGLWKTRGQLQEEEKALHESVARLEGAEEVGRQAGEGIKDIERKYSAFVGRVRQENKEQASLISVEPSKLQDIQTVLDPDQTLIEYFVAPEKTLIWVVQKGRVNALTIPVQQATLKSKVDILRNSIAELKPLNGFQSHARELYTLLIAPVLPHIRAKELIIVPHGVLHYLPFQALYSPKKRYLIQDYSITYSFSGSLLQFTKAKRKTGKDKILAFGNPDLGNPAKNLDFAEMEIKEVQKIFPGSAIFSGKEATETRSKALSPQHDILHFAAHAELEERDPLSSRILLARDGEEDGNLEVREIFEMNLNANLVVLSACDTALGQLSSGDELMGLTRAFIYAGTPSVIASLWKVDDASTASLMGSFYKNLKTKSKVESLRQAQLDMISGKVSAQLLAQRGVGGIGKLSDATGSAIPTPRSASVPTSHPYFWAPFILVGDGK
jgi:CHAT domain-containing protein